MDQIDIELRRHKFISFVEDHYNPLNVIRSLGEKGIKPIVILIGEHPILINHCRYVGVLHQVQSLEEGYEVLISRYGNEEFKPFLLCSDDNTVSYLDQRYDELKDKFIFYNAGEQGRITWMQNKDNITNLGAEAGLFCPKKEIVDTGVLPKSLKYPVITKVLASTMGAWKGDVYICQNEQELLDAYKRIKSPKLCMQEYIYKKGEFCLEGFVINDGKDVFLPFYEEYIRLYNNSYGHYMNVIPFKNKELREKIEHAFRLTRFNGIFEIEFMKGPNEEEYFLEINFRASTWNYAVTVGGGNLPYFWAKSMLLGRIPYEEINLVSDSFTAMVEPADFFGNVVHGKTVGFKQWYKELKNSKCLYYYNKHDKKPFFSFVLNAVVSGIKKRISFK